MFDIFKKNIISLPYKVEKNGDSIIIEAKGNYNESFLVFHAVIKCKDYNIERIFIHLNENITKIISLKIEYRDFNHFDFDFSNLLSKEETDVLIINDKEVLKEGTI